MVRISKLQDKKYREKDSLFCLDGFKLLSEACESGAEIEYIFVREDAVKKVGDILSKCCSECDVKSGGVFVPLSEAAFDKLSGESAPEGVITVVKYLKERHKRVKLEEGESILADGKTIMLESVRDPGNLGTILRTAAAFGIKNVIMSDDCADIYNQKTLRSAMGAVFKVFSMKVDSLELAIECLQNCGRRTFATALYSNSLKLGEFEIRENDVFIIGNEGHGLSDKIIEKAGKSVFIPMEKGTESLNAAIAASVCMWEISKK